MAKTKITMLIDSDNEVFDQFGDPNYVLWEVLGRWTDKVCHGGARNSSLLDENGNKVGSVVVEEVDA